MKRFQEDITFRFHIYLYIVRDIREIIFTWEHPSIWRKCCPSATLSTTNLTRTGLGSNASLRYERPFE